MSCRWFNVLEDEYTFCCEIEKNQQKLNKNLILL